jgi:membrane protease YdiL (CAAX protease family)
MAKLAPYAKAISAALASALAFAIPVVDDGLLPSEVLGIVLAGLIGLGVTYAVPNRPAS